MSGRTPGPWEVGPTGHIIRTTEHEDDTGRYCPRMVLARLESLDNPRNATLMAASPDLYDCVVDLNAALAAQAVGAPLPPALVALLQRRADAALAKADGGT